MTPARVAEPTADRLGSPLLRYFLATRPAFLGITVVGCLLGLASAHHAGVHLDPLSAGLALLLALLAHAGVNVLNDYYDHLNGSDARNSDRLYPYTGGSRFIQNGVMTPRQVKRYGYLLFAAVSLGGAYLAARVGLSLLWIGFVGLAIGWAYSAPPLKLASRGLGELAVMIGFILIVVGTDYVQRGAFAALPWAVGLPYALLTTNILTINQFPDRRADIAAGKLHWVARLPPRRAAQAYRLILALAAIGLIAITLAGELPRLVLVALAGMLPALQAARMLVVHADDPSQLRPAIRATIAAALLHGLLLAGALMVVGRNA